jgi:sarcosine oxidase
VRDPAPLTRLRSRPETVALYEERAGFVRPEETVKAHLDRAASLGADLRFEEPMLSWEAPEGGVRVETPDGSYEAERLVISPGAWAPPLLADMDLPLEVTRQVMYWFEPASGRSLFSLTASRYLSGSPTTATCSTASRSRTTTAA